MDKKQVLLDQVAADITKANICPDLAKQAKHLVPGDGNPDAEIVFIGEAPGKNEDEQGIPFIGAAGKFLNEMLAGIGMDRGDIFITNIVKYRPPNNRDPLPDEKKAFWPYMVRQLEIIQPKVVVTLGRHSMEYFLPDQKISQIHGEPKIIKVMLPEGVVGGSGVDVMQGKAEQRTESYEKYGEGVAEALTQQRATSNSRAVGSARCHSVVTWTVLPLYHPAAAIYNRKLKQTLIDDFNKLPTIITI